MIEPSASSKQSLKAAGYAAMFVFGVVMAMLGAVLPLISERVNLAQAGNLFLAMNLAMLVTSLTLGPLMDRFGMKAPLLGGVLLVAGSLAAMAGAGSYGALLGSVALLGIGGGALNGGSNTLIADLHVDPAEKNAALNLLGVPFGFGALFLPFVIGSLLKALGLAFILRATAGLCVLAALYFTVVRFPMPKHAGGLAWSQAGRFVRNPLVLAFGFLLFFESGNEFTMGGYTSSFLTRELHIPVEHASYLLAIYWGAIMAARIGLSRLLLKSRGEKVIGWSAIAAASGIALMLAAPSAPVAAIALAFVGSGFASIFPTTLGLAGSRFQAFSGTVFGILFAIALSGGMTLPWAVGQVSQRFGLRNGLVLSIWACFMIVVLEVVISRLSARTPRE